MSRRGRLAVAFVVAVTSLWTLAAASLANDDCFAYGQAAKSLLDGKRLYSEAWQDKPPLAILLYAAPQLVARGSYPVLQAWCALGLAASSLAFVALDRSSRGVAGWVAASFVTIAPLCNQAFLWASTENFANPFVVGLLALGVVIERQARCSTGAALAIGALAGAAFHVRQNALFFGAVPVAVHLASAAPLRDKARVLALAGGAALATFVPVLAFVLGWGDLASYRYTVFEYPRLYARATSLEDGGRLLGWFATSSGLGIILLVFGGWALARPPRVLAGSALLVGFVSCVLPLKDHDHYWANLIPSLALAAFVALEREESPRPRTRWVVIGLAGYLGLGAVANLAVAIQRDSTRRYADVAHALDRAARPGDRMLAIGDRSAYLYFASEVPPAHRFFWGLQLDRYWATILPQRIEDVVADYERSPPELIAVTKEELDLLAAGRPGNRLEVLRRTLEKRAYVLVAEVHEYRIFRRSAE